jgi:hypothetical protein
MVHAENAVAMIGFIRMTGQDNVGNAGVVGVSRKRRSALNVMLNSMGNQRLALRDVEHSFSMPLTLVMNRLMERYSGIGVQPLSVGVSYVVLPTRLRKENERVPARFLSWTMGPGDFVPGPWR